MRVLVHDYCGHPFPIQLSRKLAVSGLDVLHVFSRSVVSPQGELHHLTTDPDSLQFLPISLPKVIDRQAFVSRYFQERMYGRLLAERIREFRPDVVISANAPLEAQVQALAATRQASGSFVFWLQDVHGIAIERLLSQRLGTVGRIVGKRFRWLERKLLIGSDAIVAITEDFLPTLKGMGVPDHTVWVVPNWASPEELPPRPKNNAWSRKHAIADQFCFLYSGTLGMKHNPDTLLQLAMRYRDNLDVRVIVASEGAAAEWLKSQARQHSLPGLMVLPFQPYSDYPDVLGSADVLVGILEPDAGIFSVPSKVLSYLCAGRPILLSVPRENLAARTITRSRAGLVAEPGDLRAFLEAAESLRSEPASREGMAAAAKDYADNHFDIDKVATDFREIINAAAMSARQRDY